MASSNDISSRIEKLLDKDFSKMSTDEIVDAITGGEGADGKYVDLQSDEGFNEVLSESNKEIESIYESLKPKDPPIPMEKIEDLACNYEGDELYSYILLESVKIKDRSLYNKIIGKGLNKPNSITSEDIGVKFNDPSGANKRKLNSDEITKYLQNENKSLLEEINESIFDNLDPLLLGKPSNSGTKKKREFSILGFKIPLEFITSNGQILHVKIGGNVTSNEQARNQINDILGKQNEVANPCDFEGLGDGEDVQNDITSYPRTDDYDSNFYPDGEDPIVDEDCSIGRPVDPVTGDEILTAENFEAVKNDFCDPPQNEFEEEIEPDPEVPPVDVDSIQACIDSAFDKADKLDSDTKLLARWQNIERALEEILYHYEIIWEYQKSLGDNWRDRRTDIGSNSSDFNLALEVLTYKNAERNLELDILDQTEELSKDRSNFIKEKLYLTTEIFTLTGFDIDTYIGTSNTDLIPIFEEFSDSGNSLVTFNDESQSYDYLKGIEEFRNNYQELISFQVRENFIESLQTQKEETRKLKESTLETLNDRKNTNIDINDIEKAFLPSLSTALDPYAQGPNNIIRNARVFQNIISPTYTYDGYGYEFLEALEKFSIRFKGSEFKDLRSEFEFNLTFMTDLGNPIPYKEVEKPGRISLKDTGAQPTKKVFEVDQEKIKIGNEYSGEGLLTDFSPFYLNSYQFVKVDNRNTGESDVADFYDFIEDIIDTNKSKNQIIQDIISDRGTLYGRLLEASGSNWLFFSASERGDNDARNPKDLKPSNFDGNGEPNPEFTDFYSNFKSKWDSKYAEVKSSFINPELDRVKGLARKAGEGLGKTLTLSDVIGVRIFENYFSVKERLEEIQRLILYTATKRSEIENSLSPENIEANFSDVRCSGAQTQPDDPDNCPPKCCGEPGADFKSSNYLLSSPPSSDCPTIYQKCWWKQFSVDLTKVGLLPYPNGLPPIEDPTFFLSGGPSVRLGFKYWPVGYLPPAFIPIPISNPIDGQPYIRIPLPMIWTIIPPIVIPLPLGLGVLVIFIPFIGGFMPTPLVYLKEFLGNNSLFLTGIRGPRFIPRKSDPTIEDPLEKIKQALTFGIPDKLIPLPGMGLDDLDLPKRIITDLQSNLTKIFDSINPPSNLDSLRNVQDREISIKEDILNRRKEYLKKSALLDDPEPDFTLDNQRLEDLVEERKSALIDVINDYIDSGIPTPKSIYYPKDKDKLKMDIPGILKTARSVKDMKAGLSPVKSPETINYKDEIREVLKTLKIPTPVQYLEENKDVSNANQILLKVNKDPRTMNKDEFDLLVNSVSGSVIAVTQTVLKGNKLSVVSKIRDGALSVGKGGLLQGTLAFPPFALTNSAPSPLNFTQTIDPIKESMYVRIMNGMSSSNYTRDEFSEYVRYDSNDNPQLVIRVKDLKKIVSKKMGLSKKGPFEDERPLDKEPLLSKYPFPQGPLGSIEGISSQFGVAISLFELPTAFPPKQDQISQTPGAGGIPQITIPGSVVKTFIKETVSNLLSNGKLEEILPEINDIESPKFTNLEPEDIGKIARNLVREVLDPNGGSIPPFLEIAQIPVIPPARPTDLIEQVLIGMGVPPPARIIYSLMWKYFKGVPKVPLGSQITLPVIEIASNILTKIPWPITVLIGRNLLNIINPIVMNDDLPVWRRMSLKNPYYVVYLDEFLRSAADVSGLFKFFFGSADPVYPIPELPSELQKAFNVKKY